jgi:hypothetical protein
MLIVRKLVHMITFILSIFIVLFIKLLKVSYILMLFMFFGASVSTTLILKICLKIFMAIQRLIYNKLLLYYGQGNKSLNMELTKKCSDIRPQNKDSELKQVTA